MAALSTFASMILVVAGFGTFYYFSVLLHEVGHLLAAKLVGWHPVALCIGHGRRRTLFQIAEIDIQIGSQLAGGTAYAFAHQNRRFRTAQAWFVLGGPAASLLLAGILYWAAVSAGHTDKSAATSEWVWMLFAIEVWLLLISLWPHLVDFRTERLPSDGLLLWRTLRSGPADVDRQFAGHVLAHATWLLDRGCLTEARDTFERGRRSVSDFAAATLPMCTGWIHLLLNANHPEFARTEAKKLLEDLDLSQGFRVALLDSLACVPIFFGHQSFLRDALEFIDEAIHAAPEEVTLRGTKGSLLIELGDLDLGEQLIRSVLRDTTSKNDEGICTWYLALLSSRRGDLIEAHRLHSEAKAMYADCVVANRIDSELKILNPEPLTSPTE